MKAAQLKQILDGIDDSAVVCVELQVAPEVYLQQEVEGVRQEFYMGGADLIIMGKDSD